MNDTSDPKFWRDLVDVLLLGTGQTLYMVSISLVVTIVIGLPLGVLLVGTERGGLFENLFGSRMLGRVVNRVLDFIVNLGRSIPFIILMIAVIPFTRIVVGTFIGSTAAIVPLSLVAIPFFARMVEIALKEIDPGLTEAANSLGATRWQIVRKVLVPEALPSILLGLATTVTSIINFSAMVGTVAGGGLGDVAFRYGYQRYSTIHIVAVIIIIFIIVQSLAAVATHFAKRLSRTATDETHAAVTARIEPSAAPRVN
ncbi:MAG: transporter permease [Microbacteriaceae bacterium]|nr:transporter permease [Microbacteriaceae bacterium]